MRILVTAGNTQTPIDAVRCITNIFTGQTGLKIAECAHAAGHAVALCTSHPQDSTLPTSARWQLRPYRTFDDLAILLETEVKYGKYDAIIHSAAVSDYALKEVWNSHAEVLNASGKISSQHDELVLKLTKTPKLIDRFRRDYRFQGLLIKFKLEVGLTTPQLLEVAEKSRLQSQADWLIANHFETRSSEAFLGNSSGYERIERGELATRVVDILQASVQA
jgi:phosphopantothenate---cysteine ligase (CTP)